MQLIMYALVSQRVWKMFGYVVKRNEISSVATGGFGGLSPPNKAPSPPQIEI